MVKNYMISKTGSKARMAVLTTLNQVNAECSSHCNKVRKENKNHMEQKEK